MARNYDLNDPNFVAVVSQAESGGRQTRPDYVFLTYSVCAGTPSSCGWQGWLLEAAFRRTEQKHNTYTGDALVPAITNQTCPNCGTDVFRTGVDPEILRN